MNDMGLGKIYRTKWLSIHAGRVELADNGDKQLFAYVEGRLISITNKERNYGGENVQKWYIELQDEQGERYTITFPYSSGTFKSIILALASDETLSPASFVRIEPYMKGQYTNVVVYLDGVKLDWICRELPPVENVTINGRTFKDEGKRMEYICSLVAGINEKLMRKTEPQSTKATMI